MKVNEILERRDYLSSKLHVIDNYIKAIPELEVSNRVAMYSKAISYKFGLLSKIRSHTILLDTLNKEAVITVGDTDINIYEALHLLDTLKNKIDTFSEIVINDPSVDIFSTMEKQDILFEEYIDIYLGVLDSNSTTVWEN